MYKLIGALIKKERLRKNYSQETLCKGICVVSYLSKIEKGVVKADDEIIKKLFEVLDIEFQMDKSLLKEKEKIYYMMDESSLHREAGIEKYIEENKAVLSKSIVMIDFILLEFLGKFNTNKLAKNDEKKIIEAMYYMDETQKYYANSIVGLYYLFHTKNLEKAKKYFYDARIFKKSSIPLYYYALSFYSGGEYLVAVDILYKVFSEAIEEGYLTIAINACIQLAACYSNQNNMYLMMKYYKQALNLTNDDGLKDSIYYNCGASFLISKNYEEALKYLKMSEELRVKRDINRKDVFYVYHKLAILYDELNNLEEAKKYVVLAKAECKEEEFFKSMIKLVEIRCDNEDYLHDDYYGKLLKEVYDSAEKEIHYGFKIFHANYYIDYLKANRRYKEALEVLESVNKQFSLRG